MLADNWPRGRQGIGHTRWATHGQPNEVNAHPHTDCTGDVVVIHNGIVENHLALKQRLTAAGHEFASETDTEVIPHLIEEHLRDGKDMESALAETIQEISGAHAILAMSTSEPGTLVAARVGNAGGIVVGNELERQVEAAGPHELDEGLDARRHRALLPAGDDGAVAACSLRKLVLGQAGPEPRLANKVSAAHRADSTPEV